MNKEDLKKLLLEMLTEGEIDFGLDYHYNSDNELEVYPVVSIDSNTFSFQENSVVIPE